MTRDNFKLAPKLELFICLRVSRALLAGEGARGEDTRTPDTAQPPIISVIDCLPCLSSHPCLVTVSVSILISHLASSESLVTSDIVSWNNTSCVTPHGDKLGNIIKMCGRTDLLTFISECCLLFLHWCVTLSSSRQSVIRAWPLLSHDT